MFDFEVVDNSLRDTVPARSARHVVNPFLEKMRAGETVFIPITPETMVTIESRLGQYYGVAKKLNRRFIRRKTEYKNKDGFMCWFVNANEPTESTSEQPVQPSKRGKNNGNSNQA